MENDSQQLLLQQVRQGDRDALGQLLENLRPYIRVIVRSQRRETCALEFDDSDLIQDVLVQASQDVCSFHGVTVGEWLAWLRTITVRTTNRTLNSVNATARGNFPDLDLATLITDKQTDPHQNAVWNENANRITLALARLPDDMQRVLLGRLVNNLGHTELAEQLGRSTGAVRVLYLRALRKLRDIWQSEFSSSNGDSV
jgi:RNA polymerase sigma-70 factor (ECF subfamily)